MLRARDLHFAYAQGGFRLRVPELHAAPGETLALSGPSGTGKTTLLKILAGILPPQGGSLAFAEDDLRQMSPAALRRLRRRHMGLVFQDFALPDYLPVRDNILLPLRLEGALTPEHEQHARTLVDALDLTPHWRHLTGRLSQGEQQRVAVARALVHRPRLVLADEPTSALDPERARAALHLLIHHVKEHQAALVMVSHDASLLGMLDRSVHLGEAAS